MTRVTWRAVPAPVLLAGVLAGCESVDVPPAEAFLDEKQWRNDLCVFESATCDTRARR